MMRNVMLKSSLYLLVLTSAVSWFCFAHLDGLNLSSVTDFFGLIPKVVSVDVLVVVVFVKWGWGFKMFRGWLVPFPNLNGSWVGFVYSDWRNPNTGEKLPPVPVMLTVNQSFFHVSCVVLTSEMESTSYSEGFLIDPDRQVKKLAYSYTSKPRLSLSERSVPHDGAAVFKIVEKPEKKLVGRYWTDRLTKGEIVLNFYSKDRLEELPENLGEHPVTESENRR